ncbi:MAG: OsmC family protein [Caulobacteraceae bacterium]|nr:OsmC family protein [Caulobacteraceae bacterium]
MSPGPMPKSGGDAVIVSETLNGPFQNEAITSARRVLIDQPVQAGGMGMGPDPFEVVAAALGACTAQTLRMYVNDRQWPVHRIRVAVSTSPAPETGRVRFERTITCEGELSDAQRTELVAAAERSPVNSVLNGSDVATRFGPIGDPVEEARQARISHWIMLHQALRAS